MLNPNKFNPVASLKALVEAAYHNPNYPFIWVETPHSVTDTHDQEWVVRYFPSGEFGSFYTDGFDCLGGEVDMENTLLIQAKNIEADFLIAPNSAALPIIEGEVYGLIGNKVKVMTGNPAFNSSNRSQEQLAREARISAALMGMYTHNTLVGTTIKVARVGECFDDIKIESITL